ncbi:hypothetical protein M758_4G046900 [Ceratodon purpureus]|nr:hypothetical protein M758_4G046900 [Ceratodon purpureus]
MNAMQCNAGETGVSPENGERERERDPEGRSTATIVINQGPPRLLSSPSAASLLFAHATIAFALALASTCLLPPLRCAALRRPPSPPIVAAAAPVDPPTMAAEAEEQPQETPQEEVAEEKAEEMPSEEEAPAEEEEEAPAEEEEEEEEEEEVHDPKPELENSCKPKCVKQLLALQVHDRVWRDEKHG